MSFRNRRLTMSRSAAPRWSLRRRMRKLWARAAELLTPPSPVGLPSFGQPIPVPLPVRRSRR